MPFKVNKVPVTLHTENHEMNLLMKWIILENTCVLVKDDIAFLTYCSQCASPMPFRALVCKYKSHM